MRPRTLLESDRRLQVEFSAVAEELRRRSASRVVVVVRLIQGIFQAEVKTQIGVAAQVQVFAEQGDISNGESIKLCKIADIGKVINNDIDTVDPANVR